MKVKHSKYKNTGILFELLTRQLTSDTIAGNQPKALSFLKNHFNSKSELLKEYKIYHTLATQKYKCKFFLATGKNTEEQKILHEILDTEYKDKCVPLDDLSLLILSFEPNASCQFTSEIPKVSDISL